ncbi:MAG: hypothetical protein ACOX1O_00015 [Eggerthellaceae bacterium]|jgi:hypothetical protein
MVVELASCGFWPTMRGEGLADIFAASSGSRDSSKEAIMEKGIGARSPMVLALVFSFALGVFACLLATAQPAQAATAQNVTLIGTKSKANSANSYSKTVTGYDITGDKKADKLTIKTSHSNKGYTYKGIVRVYVNGKKAKTLSVIGPPNSVQFRVKYMRTSSKKPFLYIALISVNNDGNYGVYRFKFGKLVKLVKKTSNIAQKYGTHMNMDTPKAVGKKISVRFNSMTWTIGQASYTYNYRYKSGKLVRTSAVASRLTSFKGVSLKKQPLAYSTKIYKAAGSKKVAFTAKAGTKLTISKMKTINGRPWFQVKKANGQKGWIRGIKKSVTEIYGSYEYSTPFKNLYMAG